MPLFYDLAENLSDIHIKLYDLEDVAIYPTGLEESDQIIQHIPKILEHINEIKEAQIVQTSDFALHYEDVSFRCASVSTVEGELYTLRAIKPPKELKDLKVSNSFVNAISSKSLHDGGLVLITGLPGHGKTTICVASIIHRLEKFGGICYTVEDPPEIPFQGSHGDGVCFQTDSRDLGGYPNTIKNLLRAYPSHKKSLMLIGEIRDPDTAEQALMSVLDGRLVFATMHAGTLTDAIKRIVTLASKNMGREPALSILSKSFKMCVNQSISRGRLKQAFFILDSAISSLIVRDKINQISSEIERQEILNRQSIRPKTSY